MSTFTLLPAMKIENIDLMFVPPPFFSFFKLTDAEQHDWRWAHDHDRAAIPDV